MRVTGTSALSPLTDLPSWTADWLAQLMSSRLPVRAAVSAAAGALWPVGVTARGDSALGMNALMLGILGGWLKQKCQKGSKRRFELEFELEEGLKSAPKRLKVAASTQQWYKGSGRGHSGGNRNVGAHEWVGGPSYKAACARAPSESEHSPIAACLHSTALVMRKLACKRASNRAYMRPRCHYRGHARTAQKRALTLWEESGGIGSSRGGRMGALIDTSKMSTQGDFAICWRAPARGGGPQRLSELKALISVGS